MSKILKISTFLMLFLLIFLGTFNVYAQQNQINSEPVILKHKGLPTPGLLPTSPLYIVKRFFENIGTLFTFGNANKATRHFELAQKRLAEAEELASQKNFNKAKSIFEAYEKEIEKTQKYLEKSELAGKDMSKLAEKILKILPVTRSGVEEKLNDNNINEKGQAKEILQKVEERNTVQTGKGLQSAEQRLQKIAQRILVKKQLEQTVEDSSTFSQYKGSDKFGQCDSFIPTVIADDIQDTKALGFGWARPFGDVFAQETIEKQKGSYDFSVPDAVVKKLQSAGLKIFGNLFPSGMPKIPQNIDLVSFENYVKAVVDRYNGDGKNDMPGLIAKITYWQVGIEPFCNSPSVNCYKTFFDLVKTAYQAAKSVDNSLMISPGGPAPIFGPNGSVDKMASGIFGYFFENGGANYMDFFNFHYLVGAKNHDIKKYIDYWKKYVPQDKEIWLSETGSRDVGDRFTISSDADEEASWVKNHISDSFQNGVSKIFWCRAEHSYSDMLEVVKVLQEYAKQYGGNPMGSVIKRQIQNNFFQSGQQESIKKQQKNSIMQFGEMINQQKNEDLQKKEFQQMPSKNIQQQQGGMILQQQMPSENINQPQPTGMMQQPVGETQQPIMQFQQPNNFQQPSGMMQPSGQQPIGNFQQPGGFGQGGGYCGDNQCDLIEQQTGGCPQDCR